MHCAPIGVADGKGVHGNLLRASEDNALHVLDRAYAAADCKRNPYCLRDRLDHADVDWTALCARRDVVEDKLVCAAIGIPYGHLDRIAEIDVVLELDALRDTPVADIEAGNNALRQHDSHSFSNSRPILPDFSGWNWQAQRRPFLTIAVNFTPAYSVKPAVSGTTSA